MNYKLVVAAFLFALIAKMTYNLRRPLAKMIFEKMEHQNEHLNASHEEWYSVNHRYLSQAIMDRFLQLHQDDETSQFIEDCFTKADWLFTQVYHGLAKSLLTLFMSATSANGLLNRGSMFVLSQAHIRLLLDCPGDDGGGEAAPATMESLLDLGAGDGNITVKFRPIFQQLYATEVSSPMQWRLRQKEISVLSADSWVEDSPPFVDVIACLNLLDRCDRPLTLLDDIRRKLRPGTGLLLLALVFPVRQYVEGTNDHRPVETLPLAATRIWEVQLNHFVREVVEPAGFKLVRWSRVPYLCEGDFSRSFYSLNDVIMVLKPVDD